MVWNIDLFESPRKEKPVGVFIKSLEKNTRAKVAYSVNLLREYGPNLAMPYSKFIGSKLYELRIRGREDVRIFYSFLDNKIYLLHGFKKKTQKTPQKEIRLTLERLKILTKS